MKYIKLFEENSQSTSYIRNFLLYVAEASKQESDARLFLVKYDQGLTTTESINLSNKRGENEINLLAKETSRGIYPPKIYIQQRILDINSTNPFWELKMIDEKNVGYYQYENIFKALKSFIKSPAKWIKYTDLLDDVEKIPVIDYLIKYKNYYNIPQKWIDKNIHLIRGEKSGLLGYEVY